MGPRRRSAGKADGRDDVPAALLKRKVATLFRSLPMAFSGDVEAVHQLRVSSRRLRVALRLLVEEANGRTRRALRSLAQLARIAGRARDLDVLRETFERRLHTLPSRSAEQVRLRQRLAALRRGGRARSVDALLDFEVARLRADLVKLAARRGPARSVVGERFRRLRDRQGHKLQDGFAALGAQLDVPELHRLRRRARRLRYAVEVYLELFGGAADATKPWKDLQDRIGVLHDHYLLAEWFERQAQADRRRGQPTLAAAASAERDWAREAMARLHAELLAADPKALIVRGLAAVDSVAETPR